MNLCKYKDILGTPNVGLHSYRILNIAIFDVIGTFIIAYLIVYFNPEYKFWKVSIILLILGIILHRIFCVNTTINKLIFGIVRT